MDDDQSEKEYDFVATLVFIVDGKRVLLAPKKAKLGKGLFNGYGGEVEQYDPSVEFRATLEMWQKSKMICAEKDLKKVAIGYFSNIKAGGETFICKVHIFLAEERYCVGVPTATSKMGRAQWFDVDRLPFEKMMAADRHWLPEIFQDKKIIVSATLKNKQSELVGDVEIVQVQKFD